MSRFRREDVRSWLGEAGCAVLVIVTVPLLALVDELWKWWARRRARRATLWDSRGLAGVCLSSRAGERDNDAAGTR